MIQLLIAYNQAYETKHPVVAKHLNTTFETCLAKLSQRIKDQNISFVHGKGQWKETTSGYIKEETVYECESCEACPFKSKCITAKGNKKLSVSKEFITYREKSLENLKSDDGMIIRVNRSIQVEGAFGALKQNMGFKRFFSRGLKNVTLEFYLLAFAYHIQKFHQKNQNDRLGHHLHEFKKT